MHDRMKQHNAKDASVLLILVLLLLHAKVHAITASISSGQQSHDITLLEPCPCAAAAAAAAAATLQSKSHVILHTSHFTLHNSHFTRHTSLIIRHLTSLFLQLSESAMVST